MNISMMHTNFMSWTPLYVSSVFSWEMVIIINNANYVDYEDKRVHSYKLLRRVPGTICCHLVPKGVCFHPSILILEMEEESVQAIILGSNSLYNNV